MGKHDRQSGAPPGGRRTLRERKVSQRMAVVDESTRRQAAQARLDALENDNEAGDTFGAAGSDDDEFVVDDDDDDEPGSKRSKKKKAAGNNKRKARGIAADWRGPKSFQRLLEEAELERQPPGQPNYLTAAAGPSVTSAVRKFCSVCGNMSGYTCSRCGSRYCCKKCYTVHSETRCLKFTA